VDVELCVKLDKKLKFINNARQICALGLVPYESIFKSQPYIYGMLLLQGRQEGITLPSLNHFAEKAEVSDDPFEGAYVFEPQTGFYSAGVFSVDFNSLYPNIMISLNISPETKLAKVKSQTDTHVELIMHPSNDIKRLTIADFKKLKEKTIVSSNNVIYCKHETKHGIIAKFCDRMYNSRVSTKKKMKQLEKNDDQASKFEYDRLDIVQNAYKVIMNSIYGIMGNRYFSMFDLDNAMAITLTGQALIQNSASYVNNYFRNSFGADYDVVLAGDTDSLYINARPYVEAAGGIPSDKEGVKKLCDGLEKIVEKINDDCKSFIMETFNTDVTTIQFKRETFCASGCFVAKKRYVLHVIDSEGKPVDKFKYVGVDIKKNELPKDIKSMLRLIVEGAMKKHWNNAAFQKIMINIREKYLQFPPEKIAFLKNYGTEKKADGFLGVEKGTGMHAKAVIYHNQLIKTLKIQNKEEEIFVNDRFRYVQVKPINGYNIDVIAFKETWPEEFSKYFMVDYDTMFQKTMCAPLKAFIKAFGWKEFKFIDSISGDLMDL
jgi:DNA polymerase elongation subunit (family B)